MFDKIIRFSLENKLLVILGVVILIIIGVFSASKIPLDAVPDITNNQVQIVSTAPTLAPQEMEQLITYPLEAAMTNIPGVVEVRSISRYGLSVITIVFEEDIPIMLARQYVQEQLNIAEAELPTGLTEPELMPITTGLGEIYQYVLTVEKEYAHEYDATRLRTIQDWIVKRQLNGTKGIIEVSSFGGYLKQYEVALNPNALKVHGLTIPEVIHSLQENNQNSGGSYIEKGPYSFYIRTEGRVATIEEINNILVKNKAGIPIKVGDIATVRIGSAKRYGAMTMDGKGEVVGGITLMFKGANSSEVLQNVKDRIEIVKESLPEGVSIYPYLDRSKLIGKTIDTVKTNLIEGGLIVIIVLLLLLGDFRAGLIVASVIPLSMLFALTMMRYFNISANLMSLGAIDFGIVIDGAVIIVESLLHTLTLGYLGQKLSSAEMDGVVQESTSKIYRSAAFGVLIILVVFIPILTLEGTEGKTFRPMAQTVGFAVLGSLFLSLTYVPAMASIFLSKKIKSTKNWADKFIDFLKSLYRPTLQLSLNIPSLAIVSTLIVFAISLWLFNGLGAEFVPTLEEGDIAMQQAIKPGSSLNESIHTSTMAEKILLENFPEVEHVVSKIGTAEVPTDPMAIEDADVMIILKDKEEWTSAKTREKLMAKMKEKLAPITWASFEFTQPIQLRFNELMTGAKSDISVKIFGEDTETLKMKADEAASIISSINGAGDVKVDQTDGLQQLSVKYNRERLAQHGVNVAEVNQVIRAAYAGEQVGDIFEQERQFELVVRIAPEFRKELDLSNLTINTVKGQQIPLNEIAQIENIEGPMLISREQARRFINIGVNVRNTDVATLVAEIQQQLSKNLQLPAGYEIQYGGQFENLENARQRLLVAVPVALALILLLLYLAFSSVVDALLIFIAVPLSAVGGILGLWIRGMPFSISSGIGFIALFGVSVLNGIVLVSAIKQLNKADFPDYKDLIRIACLSRLRPVLMTALVAALGFLPMAISTGSGAEVQRPLATVVIGGLITSTLLTLILLPTLYYLIFRGKWAKQIVTLAILFIAFNLPSQAQTLFSFEEVYEQAINNHPILKNIELSKTSELLNKNAIGQWSPFELNYQGGQINYSGFDHSFSANQDISPLFRREERNTQNAIIDERLELLDTEAKILLYELKFDLKYAYNEWQYWNSKKQQHGRILQLYLDLEPKIDLQNKVGEIGLLEYELFNSEKYSIQQSQYEIDQKTIESEWHIRKLALLADSTSIASSELKQIETEILLFNMNSNLYQQSFEKRKELLEKQIQLESITAKQNNWHIGYFAQSLEKEFLFQGAEIGVQVPIDRRQSKVKTQQLAIEREQLNNEQKLYIRQYEKEIAALQNRLQVMERSIANYDNQILLASAVIFEKSQIQYEKGEIDFLRFSQIQERLLTKENAYLDLLKSYNEQMLQLMYLTQTK
ncbi:MAG: CusA/CzcA family heavy metal efflux RND transporter [Bacteroidetes bacterium]|nr:CusA/CzcA family heavy metal efflux RND transporter [Bacteroidota bacterium]